MIRAFRITTPAFDQKMHIVYAESADKAKYKIGESMHKAGFGDTPIHAVVKYVSSVKREPGLDDLNPEQPK
jgi:hypothetical protein